MKCSILFLISLVINCSVFSQNKTNTSIAETDYFEFYSDYWINLHHFLFQKASGDQEKRIQEDGHRLLDINEAVVYKNLNDKQAKKLTEAITYYKKNIIDRSLHRGLGRERVWLQKQPIDQPITDTLFSKHYTKILNQASEVYRTTFWPIHTKQNKQVITKHLSTIKKLEANVFSKMVKLALTDWPTKTKVRVDLTAYANYAGAYTPTRPKFNLFISTLDPRIESTTGIEILFHEGSHLFFRYGGPYREGISKTFNKKGLKIKYPGHLWHASMFYLCGRVVQDELKKLGSTAHQLIIDDRNVYSNYNTPEFRKALESYYQNEHDFETTIIKLLDNLNSQ
ncbi:hypothetical protein [Aquimarina algiphila]|uniref:hypothetical protein n=1 Tax=Aquimarina algiphila TaxID=2047982 RepID=UPI00233001E3|nr:hypothetical protein [Aquimarina algiphila]